MFIKYRNRRIKSEKHDNITTFAYCVDKKGKQTELSIVASRNGHKGAINEMKKLVDRAIHYNGY